MDKADWVDERIVDFIDHYLATQGWDIDGLRNAITTKIAEERMDELRDMYNQRVLLAGSGRSVFVVEANEIKERIAELEAALEGDGCTGLGNRYEPV